MILFITITCNGNKNETKQKRKITTANHTLSNLLGVFKKPDKAGKLSKPNKFQPDQMD